MSMSVNRGEQVNLSCTYESQGNVVITWNGPVGDTLPTPTNTTIDENTTQSRIMFTADNSSYTGNYSCSVAVDGMTPVDSNVATVTVSCKLSGRLKCKEPEKWHISHTHTHTHTHTHSLTHILA